MKNAPGVVLDDLAAGLWALALLRLAGTALARVVGCDGGGWYCAG
jgi:hypothetical protein